MNASSGFCFAAFATSLASSAVPDPVPPGESMARMIALKLRPAGQPGVAFYGDENYMVRTVGLGTGCICNPLEFMDMEMDLAIAVDDSINT